MEYYQILEKILTPHPQVSHHAKLQKVKKHLGGLFKDLRYSYTLSATVYETVGITELYHSTKMRQHSFNILKSFFVRHSSEYENVG